ncbi:hypothetical protein ASPZODRAFT_66106 [Penicilliopsis zonata CBS 506.65]|uniref:Uncharacterized protein n=1 Tax=Penicilliopsis zonata CBS 506.65 TaxID=1073090 RepID=A0A1L9SHN1_9EURO|nr:hypothetical protein ASPZODRAFT_66106 [Penicilliopsis zonata CBS 506.65]OJJ46544.1 hypothetical protein ASPZODRAFT_66106 [Penicilliopsis zonata CBS 506.65]
MPKTCLITGCSDGGIGCALAFAFQERGYHVIATARSPAKVPQTLHAADNVTVLALDVASSASIVAVAETVNAQTGGKLDVLINNAGLGCDMPALDTSIAKARELFDVNFFGALEMIQVFSPILVNAGGCVVNNSSVGGQFPIPFIGIYQATKAALIQAGEVLRLEMAPLGVRVMTLLTGGVDTNFLGNLPPVVLPENSYYTGIKDIIEHQPDRVPFAITPAKYAKDVVCQVENGTTGKYWIGGAASMARFSLWALPQWILVSSIFPL